MCKYVSNFRRVGIYVFKFNTWGIRTRVKYRVELLLYDTSGGEISRLPFFFSIIRSRTWISLWGSDVPSIYFITWSEYFERCWVRSPSLITIYFSCCSINKRKKKTIGEDPLPERRKIKGSIIIFIILIMLSTTTLYIHKNLTYLLTLINSFLYL